MRLTHSADGPRMSWNKYSSSDVVFIVSVPVYVPNPKKQTLSMLVILTYKMFYSTKGEHSRLQNFTETILGLKRESTGG